MLKILVADDEFYARKGLMKKIHMAEPEGEILGDFEDGAQALSYIREHKGEVDVLFTDVKMPEMDGLELSKHIAEEELETEIVIVSGYNEFKYAQQAISFGVSNYLMKPVQLEELKEALQKIRNKTRRYEQTVQKRVQDQMFWRTLGYLSIPELVSHEEWKEQFLSPVFKKNADTPFFLAVLQGEKRNQDSDFIRRELEQFLSSRNGYWFYFRRYQEYAVILFEEGRRELIQALQSFLKKIYVTRNEKMTVGISQQQRGVTQLKKAYQEAVYAINQRLIEGWVKIYVYEGDLKPFNYFTKEKEVLLYEAIEKQKTGTALEMVSQALFECKDAYSLYITISGIFNLLYKLYCRSARSEEKDTEHIYMLFSYRSDLYGFKSLAEVEQYVHQIVGSMCQEQEERGRHYIVEELLEYIEKNYQENIHLSELAEHKYFMNNSYLSRLFKNQVGQTFSKYLMEYRIRKAAGLLESGLLKISDVAMLTGYNDVSHFIQYFKKFYGCTPEDYRNKRMEEMKYVQTGISFFAGEELDE